MPKKIFRDLQKVWVCGQQLQISRLNESDVPPAPAPRVFTAKREFSKPREFASKGKFAGGGKSEGTSKVDFRHGQRSGRGTPCHGGANHHLGHPPSQANAPPR